MINRLLFLRSLPGMVLGMFGIRRFKPKRREKVKMVATTEEFLVQSLCVNGHGLYTARVTESGVPNDAEIVDVRLRNHQVILVLYHDSFPLADWDNPPEVDPLPQMMALYSCRHCGEPLWRDVEPFVWRDEIENGKVRSAQAEHWPFHLSVLRFTSIWSVSVTCWIRVLPVTTFWADSESEAKQKAEQAARWLRAMHYGC